VQAQQLVLRLRCLGAGCLELGTGVGTACGAVMLGWIVFG
jgi:hypothetical protein